MSVTAPATHIRPGHRIADRTDRWRDIYVTEVRVHGYGYGVQVFGEYGDTFEPVTLWFDATEPVTTSRQRRAAT